MKLHHYKITKRFISGILSGLVLDDMLYRVRNCKFQIGKTYKSISGSKFQVLNIQEI